MKDFDARLVSTFELLDAEYPGDLGNRLIPVVSRSKETHQIAWVKQADMRSANGNRQDHLRAMAEHVDAGGNLGLALPKGVLVLDADDARSAAALVGVNGSETVSKPTPRNGGGAHVFFSLPTDTVLKNTTNLDLGDGITADIRTHGAMVIVWPSLHPETGKVYERMEWPDHFPPFPPEFLEKVTKRHQADSSPEQPGPVNYRIDGLPIEVGERNKTLFRIACRARGDSCGEGAIFHILVAVNSARCVVPLPRIDLERIAHSAAKYAPNQAVALEKGTKTSQEPAIPESAVMEDEPRHIIGFKRATELEEKKVEFIVPSQIPRGMLTCLAGEQGVGKGALISHFAARASVGEPLLPGSEGCDPMGVMIFSSEDSWDRVWLPRFLAAGGDPQKLFFHEGVPRRGNGEPNPLEIPNDAPWLEDEIFAAGVGLVVFDPILEFLSETVREISSKSVRRALRPLISVAERTRCTFINVHHLNKNERQSAAYRIADSHQFIAVYRAGYLVAKDPDDPLVRVAQPIKTSHAPEGAVPAWQFQLRNDEQRKVPVVNGLRTYTRGNADWMLNEEVRRKQPTKTGDAESFICGIKNGATMAEIESRRAGTSITKKTFDNTLRRLKEAGVVETRPTGEGAKRALFHMAPGNSEKAK